MQHNGNANFKFQVQQISGFYPKNWKVRLKHFSEFAPFLKFSEQMKICPFRECFPKKKKKKKKKKNIIYIRYTTTTLSHRLI